MACSSTLNSGINGRCDTSMGGIVEVAIANYATGIFTLRGAEETTTDVTEAISAEADASTATTKWYKFQFRKGTSQMSSTLTIDDANGINYVSTELQMLFGRMDTEKRISIGALAQSELVAVVKDCNGKYWALGVVEPITASAGEGMTGQARGDSNHYSITLTDDCPVFPLPVENGEAIMAAAVN